MKVSQFKLKKNRCLFVLLILSIIVPVAAIAGSITGNVMDTLGEQPIIGLYIQLIDHSSGSWLDSVPTDAGGDYTFSNLSTGNYVVMARTSGTAYAYEFYDNSYTRNSASPVAVTQGEVKSGINFSLDAGASISGTVIETATDNPVENIRVYACEYTSGYCVSDDMTDANGEYTVTGLAPGSYRIWVDCSNTNFVNEYYNGTYASNLATEIAVTQAQTVSGIDFSLEQGGTITGVITESGSGDPIDGIRIEVKDYSMDFTVGSATTQSDGSYTIMGIPAVGHRVVAWDPQRNYFQVWYDNTIYWNSASQVDVVQNQMTANIDFTLNLAGTISGTVTGSDSQPLADVWVTAYSARCWDNWVGSDKTDANGDYSISGLPPGKVFLIADATYQGPQNYANEWWNGVTGTTDCNTAMPITVVAEQDLANTDFILDHKFAVELVVKRVQKSDGTIFTTVEVMFEDSFNGTLPDDIVAIILTGPSGVLSSAIGDFEYYPQHKEFYLEIPGDSELGEYSIEVNSSDSATGTDKDYQRVNQTIPIPDSSKFSPAAGATLNSKTPTFTWTAIEYSQVPVFYKMIILDEEDNWFFSTEREQNLFSCTVPDGILEPGETYKWYVRVGDSSDWIKEDNRSNSEALTFTMAGTLAPHSSIPAIDPASWAAVNSTNENGHDFSFSVYIIDHDGVAYDGTSHTVTVTLPNGVTFPDGTSQRQMQFSYPISPTSAEYYLWVDMVPQTGDYTFSVTDPDGNVATYVETLDVNPLDPPDEDSFTPSLKNPVAETITATFDNVKVNGILYDDFNSYASVDDLDYTKWDRWHDNASIQDQKLSVTLNDAVGRGSGGLNFTNPDSVNSIEADITVPVISMDASAGARISGYFFNNGTGDVFTSLYVKKNKVTYGVSVDSFNQHETIEWNILAQGELMDVTPGQTVNVSISWDGSKLVFDADGITAEYIATGNITPPIVKDKSLLARMNLVTSTTPTFTWDPVAGANRYKIKIFSFNNKKVVWNGSTGNETSYTVPPGALVPNAYYRYRIEARDAHSPLNIDNRSVTPASSNNNYRFYTGSAEAVEPYIELDSSGVQVWNNELFGPHPSFWIKVHDAQGVPGDIKSVKVIYPGGSEKFLYYYPGSTSNTSTGGIYQSTAYPATIENGTYTFIVEDLSGNSYSVEETLTSNPIGYPDVSTLTPVHNTLVNSTGLDFDWEDVSGTAFYRLEIYDTDDNRLYAFATTQSEYHLPEGFLKEETLYRYRIKTRREFFDQNVDHGSSSPWAQSESLEFLTTSVTGSSFPDPPDLNSYGAYVCHTVMPGTSNSSYWLSFEVKVTDSDGVPANIQSVQVVYPDGVTRDLRYSREISATEAIYEGDELYNDSSAIQEGNYIFIVTDHDGNMRVFSDTLVVNDMPLPVNVTPAADSIVMGTTPTIEWDDVPGATRYRVRLYDGWGSPIQWSDYLTDSTYTFAEGILELNKTYSYRIYSYREPAEDPDLDNCSIHRIFYSDMPHFTIRADSDGDGVPDFQDAFPDDISEWLDTDSDGTGDNADTDDDNDLVADVDDDFPKDATEWWDTDSDGIGNNADPDDDNDGYADGLDGSPLVVDAPGGAFYVYTTDTRLYTISGNIFYAGAERQPILVAVFDDAEMTTILAETELASPSGSGPWSYSITDVPARNEYYLEAFMDFNADEALDDGEPEGIIGAFGIAASMTGKDVELEGVGSAVMPMPWIPLLLLQED